MGSLQNHEQETLQFQRIAQAVNWMVAHQEAQPKLSDVAKHVGVSESHLQRTFSAWAGISPKQFSKYLTRNYAKQRLRQSPVLSTAIEAGLSGGGRLHDLMISCEGVTPGEYRRGGLGVNISWGVHPSPFGLCFIAATDRGICKLAFIEGGALDQTLDELSTEWPKADIEQDETSVQKHHQLIFDRTAGGKLHLLLRGSPFQLQVWEALLTLPEGAMIAYGDLAKAIDKPKASRAVASAVAANPIGYLIPCHRVIRASGALGEYRWGADRKAAILGLEAAQLENS